MWENYFQILEKYFWDHIWNVGVIYVWLDLVSNLTLEQKIWNSMILLYSVSPTKFLVYVLYFGCWVYCLLVYGMTSMKLPNYMYTCSKWLCSFMKKHHLKWCDFSSKIFV